jgi:hypothetical protein
MAFSVQIRERIVEIERGLKNLEKIPTSASELIPEDGNSLEKSNRIAEATENP